MDLNTCAQRRNGVEIPKNLHTRYGGHSADLRDLASHGTPLMEGELKHRRHQQNCQSHPGSE